VRIAVRLVPDDEPIPPRATVVVVDILRATTTLTVALAHGAKRVIAAASPEEAFTLKRRHSMALLCGEREGRKIPGFDLGNSPLEYGRAVVAGRTLIFASTNGSAAIRQAADARRRLLGAFVNASALAETVSREKEVLVLCAGQLGRFSLEDALFAGWLVKRLEMIGFDISDDGARMARALAPADETEIATLVQGASHARYLRSLGASFARDVEACAALDRIGSAFEI
jgi:2-phosphosulfolactate phosphatase